MIDPDTFEELKAAVVTARAVKDHAVAIRVEAQTREEAAYNALNDADNAFTKYVAEAAGWPWIPAECYR